MVLGRAMARRIPVEASCIHLACRSVRPMVDVIEAIR